MEVVHAYLAHFYSYVHSSTLSSQKNHLVYNEWLDDVEAHVGGLYRYHMVSMIGKNI